MALPLKRLAGPIRAFGWRVGLLYMLDRLLRMVSPNLGLQVFELMVQPITAKGLLPPKLAAQLSLVEIGPDHPAVAEMPARADIKAHRFEQGARCLGALLKGKLIGYLWLSEGRYEEDQARCSYELEPAARSVFDFDLVVLPEYRMGIGFVGVWHVANQYLHERGIVHTFSRLTRFNLSSRRAHAHLGWQRVARAVFFQAWALELMVSDMAPYVAFSLSPQQRVRLKLRAPAAQVPAPTSPSTPPPSKEPSP